MACSSCVGRMHVCQLVVGGRHPAARGTTDRRPRCRMLSWLHSSPPPPSPPPPFVRMRERREHAANKLMASSAGLAGSLKWRWSGPSTIEGSNIGVVLAAASERPGTVFVYGVLGQGARLAMHRSASPGLQCSLSSRPETLVRPTGIAMLFEGYARPDFYTQRYE